MSVNTVELRLRVFFFFFNFKKFCNELIDMGSDINEEWRNIFFLHSLIVPDLSQSAVSVGFWSITFRPSILRGPTS